MFTSWRSVRGGQRHKLEDGMPSSTRQLGVEVGGEARPMKRGPKKPPAWGGGANGCWNPAGPRWDKTGFGKNGKKKIKKAEGKNRRLQNPLRESQAWRRRRAPDARGCNPCGTQGHKRKRKKSPSGGKPKVHQQYGKNGGSIGGPDLG